MDPGWPSNPPNTIICVLCKSSINYVNRNPERFFRHLMADHQTYHNFNILLEVSLVQPEFRHEQPSQLSQCDSQQLECTEQPISRPNSVSSNSQPPKNLQFSSNLSTRATDNQAGDYILPDNIVTSLSDLGDFDLSFLAENVHSSSDGGVKSETLNIHLEELEHAMETPQSREEYEIVSSEVLQETAVNEGKKKNHSGDHTVGNGGNRHLVPDDLKTKIIEENPDKNIKFTLSQRMNTQMVIDDFVLKKKKGPFMSRGGRVINWKCVNDSCSYSCVSYEGQVQDHCKEHNHPAQPELYVKKQARVRIRENLANLESSVQCGGDDRPVSNVVNDVVSQANDDIREMIGSVDALKQAARRFNRKLLGQDQKQTRTRSNRSPAPVPIVSDSVHQVIKQNINDDEDVSLNPGENIALEKLLKTSPCKKEFEQLLNIEF